MTGQTKKYILTPELVNKKVTANSFYKPCHLYALGAVHMEVNWPG